MHLYGREVSVRYAWHVGVGIPPEKMRERNKLFNSLQHTCIKAPQASLIVLMMIYLHVPNPNQPQLVHTNRWSHTVWRCWMHTA